MRYSFLASCLCIAATGLSACATLPKGAEPGHEVVTLYQGQSHSLGMVEGATPVSDNPAVVDVRPATYGAFAAATLRPGLALVTWVYNDGRRGKSVVYQVLNPELRAKHRAIELLTNGIRGVRTSVVGDKIVIDGALEVPETVIRDYDRLLTIQEAHLGHVLNLVTISPALYEAARAKMEREIRADPGASEISVLWENGTYLITGRAGEFAQRERAEVIVQTYLPPMMGSASLRDNRLVLGAKLFSIRNLVVVGEPPADGSRMPASAKR